MDADHRLRQSINHSTSPGADPTLLDKPFDFWTASNITGDDTVVLPCSEFPEVDAYAWPRGKLHITAAAPQPHAPSSDRIVALDARLVNRHTATAPRFNDAPFSFGVWDESQQWPANPVTGTLPCAGNFQPRVATEYSYDVAANSDLWQFNDSTINLGTEDTVVEDELQDVNTGAMRFQGSATSAEQITESAFQQQAANAWLAVPPFTGNAPLNRRVTMQQSAASLDFACFPNEPDHDPVRSIATIPAPALGTATRHPRARCTPTGKASQQKGDRIACTKPGCLVTFGRPHELRRHLDTKHNRKQDKGFRCIFCTYEYPRLDKVRSHVEKIHGFRLEKVNGARSASPEIEGEE